MAWPPREACPLPAQKTKQTIFLHTPYPDIRNLHPGGQIQHLPGGFSPLSDMSDMSDPAAPPAGAPAGPLTGELLCKSARPSRRTSRTAFQSEPPDPDDPLLGFAPYLHAAPRRNSITPERQRGFIASLAATGIVTQAARSIGASLEALYRLRNMPGAEGFAAAWEAAIDRGMARLEDCALERAIAGEERVVVRGGEVVARWTRYDTSLIQFLLRQRRSARFGAGGGHFANLRPGHPVYERLKAEWTREAFGDEAEVLESIDKFIDDMRVRRDENEAQMAGWADGRMATMAATATTATTRPARV